MSIQCEICQKNLNSITNSHTKMHGLTISEYIKKFPGAPTISPEVALKLAARTKLANSKRDYSRVGEKISATKKQKYKDGELHAWNKGIPLSDEQKQKISIANKGNVTRAGAKLPQETKDLISESLKKRSMLPEMVAQREVRALSLESSRIAHNARKFNQFNENVKQSNLELISIDYLNRSVVLKCLVCKSEFERTKQAVEPSKCSKTVCRTCHPPATTSIGQLEVLDFIRSLGISTVSEDRSILGGKEIDILIPEKKIGIEYNGLYWHSELNYGEPKHLLWKQQFAHNKGIRLVHIFEDEWLNKSDIVKSRIRHLLGTQSNTVYARKCEIKIISSAEKNSFLDQNHLQGRDVSKICYGLFFKNELVSVMTFKPGSFIKGHRDGWELNRFASKLNIRVIGGASKLFKRFLIEHSPDQVVSFADRRWNLGGLYEKLGFKFSHCSSPSYWYLEKYSKRYHRGKFMKHTLIKSEDDNQKTEWELMQSRGFDRIWDCGTVVYKYTKI